MDNDRNSSLCITRGHLNGFSLAGVTCGPALYCYRICVMHVLVTISLTDLSNTCISSYYPISHQNDSTRVQISNKRNEWSILFTSSELFASSCKSRGIFFSCRGRAQEAITLSFSRFLALWLIMQKLQVAISLYNQCLQLFRIIT